MSPLRTLLPVAVIAIALALLIPGVTRPVLTLTGTIAKSDVVELGIDLMGGEDDSAKRQFVTGMASVLGYDRVEGEMQIYHRTRSIVGTVTELARIGHPGVAFLIALFSVVIPTLKLLLQLAGLLLRGSRAGPPIARVVSTVGKWSMVDVFVMALVVTYLAGSASGQMGDMLVMDAQLETGFWFFLGYCLFSVASTALLGQPAEAGAGARTPRPA